jgi:mannose-1-phosphate guanylyltransferase
MRRVRQAVVMAGGEGTRLRPLTSTTPKPLLPVLGRPCMEYVIRSLVGAGVEEVFLALGYRSDDIVSALGDGSGLGARIIYAYEDGPMGTAGAVKLLEDRLDDTFLVGSGDTLTDADISQLVDLHFSRGAVATMALTEVVSPEQFGIVGTSSEGRIERFKEKPRPEEVFSRVINAGTYVMAKEALDLVPKAIKYDFSKNLFPDILSRGLPLYAMPLAGYWKDIGRPADLYLANIEMAARRGEPSFIRGAVTEGEVVDEGTVADGAEIVGPCYLGRDVRLDGGKVERSAINARCYVGEGAEVSRSLLLEGCRIDASACVTDSILGRGCHIGSGVHISGTVLGDGARLDGPGSLEKAPRDGA